MNPASPLPNGVSRRLDFELAYLALLTKAGLKPLSRWEKPFDGAVRETLGQLGLKTRVVNRTVWSGRAVRELLLSTTDKSLDVYASRFAGSPVRHDDETVLLEGRLFGYPSCCVESFAASGYLKNSLRRRDQRLLFHWACPGCVATPCLLPDYKRIYRTCVVERRRRAWRVLPGFLDRFAGASLRPKVALVASMAALGILPATTLPAAADPLDPHVSALYPPDDPDLDFLSSSEEQLLRLNPAIGDQNTNCVPDGVDLAQQLSSMVDTLPTKLSGTNAFVTHHMAYGLEICEVCGASVNMGYLEICHPLENQTIQIPYVAKHFLEHGSFSYTGSVHSGRVNPPLLSFVLHTTGRGHLLSEPAETDLDNDGLRNWEEPAFGTDPGKPDSDSDQVVDGIDVARELRQTLGTLPAVGRREDGPTDRPFIVMLPMNGLETCPRCGEVQTMGFWEVINPVSGDSLTIPSMAIHYLEHGAFGWDGGQLLGGRGRIDPRQLQAVLSGEPNRHLFSVTPDQDGDWLSDQEELSLGRDPTNPDEDRNAVQDGLDLARAIACEIAGLPTTPGTNQVYRLDFPQRGEECCEICGTNVNMGFVTIFNPLTHSSVDLPYIALHYLEHDSFTFAGDVHGRGRSEVKHLLEVLFRPAVNIAMGEQDVSLRWIAKAGRTYQVFTAPDPQGPWTGGPVFQGDATQRTFTESKPADTAKRFYRVAVW